MTFLLGKKLAAIGTGFLTLTLINDAFDYVMYPLTIGFFGPYKGGVIMFLAALALNYGLYRFYNRTKKDWLGLEWLRLQQETRSKTRWGRFMQTLLRRGRWPLIAFLSWEDPFKAFVFVRGRMPTGVRFTKTDWALFIWLNFLGNLIWVVMISGVLEFFKRVIFG